MGIVRVLFSQPRKGKPAAIELNFGLMENYFLIAKVKQFLLVKGACERFIDHLIVVIKFNHRNHFLLCGILCSDSKMVNFKLSSFHA